MFILKGNTLDYADVLFLLKFLPTNSIKVARSNHYCGILMFCFPHSFCICWLTLFYKKSCHFFLFYSFTQLFVYVSMDSRISIFILRVIVNTIIGFMLFILLTLFQVWPMAALSGWYAGLHPLIFQNFLLSGTTGVSCSSFTCLPQPWNQPLLQGILGLLIGELQLITTN